MATKTAKNKIDTNKISSTIKNTASDLNDLMLDTADDLVTVAVKRGEQWSEVAGKAIKGGLKLAENQQDLVFDTLEVFKKQLKGNTKRFRTLFSKN